MPDCIYHFQYRGKNICLSAPSHISPCGACPRASTVLSGSGEFKPAMKGRLKFSIQASEPVLASLAKDPRLEVVKSVPHIETIYATATEEDIVEMKMENKDKLVIFAKAIPFRSVS